ncbi:MAG TPA: lipocalin family protein [Saprospiraceae bacterium]|nr:lipocalin family protein [Saprospiraceae bacterium]
MRSILLFALCGAFLLTSCKKDEGTSDCLKLEGTWNATSWTEDNEQFLGDTIFIISSVVEFKKLDGTQGDVDWTINYTLGGEEMFIGSYVVNASCDQVVITPKAGAPTTYQFSISGDKLTLETDENAVHVKQIYQRE